MAARAKQQLLDIPVLLAFEFAEYGKGTQTHAENMRHLWKQYAYLWGYLPDYYERKTNIDQYNETILPLLDELDAEIRKMNDSYDPAFEGISCNPEEKTFNTIMMGVFMRNVQIAAKSGILRGVSYDEGAFEV